MTTTQFILIILAVMAIVWGLLMIVRAVRKNSTTQHLPPADTQTEQLEPQKDGIPIVPRHERPEPATLTSIETGAAKETLSIQSRLNLQEEANKNAIFSVSPTVDEADLNTTDLTNDDFEINRQRAIDSDNLAFTANSNAPTDTVYSIDKNHPSISTVSSTTIISPSLMAKSDEPDAFSTLANATETLTPVVQTYDESELKKDIFSENSPILDTHIQAQIDQEQNSPLNNAEQNINISLFPNNQFDRITGKDLLSLVDKYGLKYGAMNMFHRYENKDGTGLLWFSMMQVDDEGVNPFDLNKLPLQSLKGLVLFLSLPHPKAVQGFDSMISIAGLLAQDLGASLYDHDGEPISRDSVQYMRELAMDYGKNV